MLGGLAMAGWFTPWWLFPDSDRWHLSITATPYGTACVEIGDSIRLEAARRRNGNSPSYDSDGFVATTFSRFRWRVLSPSDSFWTSQITPVHGWWGTATIDEAGTLVGRGEGAVAVEVREGGRRAISAFAVLGPASRNATDSTSPGARLRTRCVAPPVDHLTYPDR